MPQDYLSKVESAMAKKLHREKDWKAEAREVKAILANAGRWEENGEGMESPEAFAKAILSQNPAMGDLSGLEATGYKLASAVSAVDLATMLIEREPRDEGGGFGGVGLQPDEQGERGGPRDDADLDALFDELLDEHFGEKTTTQKKPALKANPFSPSSEAMLADIISKALRGPDPDRPPPIKVRVSKPRGPTSGGKAKEALKEAVMGLDEIAAGLNALFNDPNVPGPAQPSKRRPGRRRSRS